MSPAYTIDPEASSTAATYRGKHFPWKNVPTWSPLYCKLQRRSITPLHNPKADVPDSGTDSRRSASTEVEPPPKDSSASIAELADISTEIPETPTAVLDNMRHEEENNNDDGNTLYLRSRASTEIVDRDSVAANDGGLEVEEGNSDSRPRRDNDNDNDNDIISVGTSQLRRASQMELTAKMNRAGQIELVVNTNGSNNAQCSDQTLALATVLSSSLLKHDEGGLPRVDMSRFRLAKILDKRSILSKDEYKCELESLWLDAELVEKAPMGRDHIRRYEKALIRAQRIGTLRSGKRTFFTNGGVLSCFLLRVSSYM
jgi:hypothetical protein